MPAVDLTEMADRLKKDWFYQYMLAPQKFSPNTVMPSFWPGGQAINKTLPGTPPEQVEALWQYLLDGRQARMPSGVVREPLEIVVTGEAAMLRRNYQGIGKRGIGVGYPGGVNLAYDAEQMRLGMIWNGKFADPGGAWTGQGSGTVRPLGRPINFASGTDLDNQSDPWVVDDGRPPHHQFKGYILDTERRPTFRYTFDSVEVTDFFAEVIAPESMSATLRRTVTLTTSTPRDGLRFRIATGKEVLQETGGVSFIDNRLKIKIVSEHVGNVIEKDGHNHLAIDLGVKPGEEEKIVIEYLLDPQN